MSLIRLSLLIVCFAAVAVRSSDPSCASTRSTFNSISTSDENGVQRQLTGTIFHSLQSVSDNMCKLGETCCSKEAETSLYSYIVKHYKDMVLTRLTEPLMVCHNHNFFDEFRTFIEANRANLIALMRATYGFYFDPYLDIFDKFYRYLQSTVDTGSTCRMAEEWNEIFYEVYLAAYFGHPSTRAASQLPNTDAFRQCFYQHVFLEDYGDSLSVNLASFLRRYTRVMRYFRALKTLDGVIVSAVDYAFSSQCAKSIMKMTHCSSCAGYVVPTCDDLCLNVLRGCLVDLSDLFEPLEELSATLVDMQRSMNTRNGLHYFWGEMTNLDRLFFELISDTYRTAVTIETKLLTTCDASGRRPTPTKRQAGPSPRTTRGSVPLPLDSFNHSAYCVVEALSSMRTLPEGVCGSSPTRSSECWNGNNVGSYERAVFDFDRNSQMNNPEMIATGKFRKFEQQIANLKKATRDLKILTDTYQCGADDEDEDCTIPDTCEYYDNIDAPIPVIEQSGSGSASGSASGDDESPPNYTTSVDITTSVDTMITTVAETTTCHPPGEEGSDIVAGGPGVGPGGNDVCGSSTQGNVGAGGDSGGERGPGNAAGAQGAPGSASTLSSSLTLIVLVLCCVFLL